MRTVLMNSKLNTINLSSVILADSFEHAFGYQPDRQRHRE